MPREFRRRVWAGGRRLKGLVRRREAEASLYVKPPAVLCPIHLSYDSFLSRFATAFKFSPFFVWLASPYPPQIMVNRCWFAGRIIEVRRKYGLTIDRREADILERLLSTCTSTELVFRTVGTTEPSSATSTDWPKDSSPGDQTESIKYNS